MDLNRRTLLTASAAVGLVAALPQGARAQSLGSEMRTRAVDLLTSLDGAQRGAIQFPFDGRQRRAWNFMTGSRKANGVPLEEMTPAQKDLALDLLATGTSTLGLEKAMNIMLQQDILRDEWGKGSPDRNRERFSVQIYGTPVADGAWSWRWEGHHLSLTFTLVNDEIVSMTPSSFSSEPNTVPSGPYEGLVVLMEEEALGRRRYADLDGAQQRAALMSSRPLGNIRSTRVSAGELAGEGAGVPLGDLGSAQYDMAVRLIEVYTTETLPPPLADAQAARLAEQDMASIRFAWAGADLDRAIYYRLTGADMLIEFATLTNQPQHLHAVWHDTRRNFGDHVL